MKQGGMDKVFEGPSQGAALTMNFLRAIRRKEILWHGSTNAWAEIGSHENTSLFENMELFKFEISWNYVTT